MKSRVIPHTTRNVFPAAMRGIFVLSSALLLAACSMPQSTPPIQVPSPPSIVGPGGEYLLYTNAGRPSVQLRFASPTECRTWALNMAEAGSGAPRTQAPQCVPHSSEDALPVTAGLRRNADGQDFNVRAATIAACESFVAGMAMQNYATASQPCK